MLANQFDAFFFDLDGVIYVGAKPLPHAVESLKRLRELRKEIRFLTNDPCTTREKTALRLSKLGIEAYESEVVTSGWATAQYLHTKGIKTAFVLGDEHLKWECEQMGILVNESNGIGENEAVVVGWNGNVTLTDLQKAALAIHYGATFIATSGDKSFPLPEGPVPAVGAVLQLLETSTGKRPIIVGKPHSLMFETALDTLPLHSKAVMIGDNPDTDVLGAHQIGLPAILVSNNHISFPSSIDFRNPDAVIQSLQELFDDGTIIRNWTKPSFSWPEKVKAGVAGIVMDDRQRVLLIKRADNGLWGIPSGHVEPGETVEQAMVREFKEETGLDVNIRRLIGVYSDPVSQAFEYPNGEISQFITVYFECEILQGSHVEKGEEALDINYFDPDKLPSDLLPMHPKWLEDALNKKQSPFIR
ncbi:HAD-IIA family hydrolase [Bacillus horti]|uniref:HAD superfamily hydrolase (TIGR01450 family) n=1 Tax=Caldalkalibacillus horti TaxID=77523 RepID=A0ABT9VYC9_9BACI|nr:HAD-IIA family hydrolase [Bacillus horti]MDQ0165974.1 HAD superfamily hydrolase (TIGR01450 family) [Bacillus horti]